MTATARTTERQTINGINVSDVLSLVEDIKTDARNGLTRWKVATEWQGGTVMKSEVEGFSIGDREVSRRFTLNIDEPFELAGTNKFANPQEHLITAMNSCMATGFVALCSLEGIRLDSVEMVTQGEIDLRGFLGLDPEVKPGYESLSTTLRVKGDASAEKFEEIFRTMKATSPNYYNVAEKVSVNTKLEVA